MFCKLHSMITAYNYTLHPFSVTFNKVSAAPSNLRNEAVQTAQYIANQTTKPLIVALSGGIDSEAVCRSFIDAKIDFEAITLVHKHNDKVLNNYDLTHAYELCKKFNIRHSTIDLQVSDFGKHIYKFLKQGYKSRNIFRYLQLILLEIIENKNACGVLCSGEQVYFSVDDKLVLSYDLAITNSLDWINKNNTLHFPYFFQTTPEITASYLQHELIKVMTKTDKYHKSGRLSSVEKMLVYHGEWPDMQARDKTNGFSEFGNQKRLMEGLLQKMTKVDEVYKLPVDELRTQLGISD